MSKPAFKFVRMAVRLFTTGTHNGMTFGDADIEDIYAHSVKDSPERIPFVLEHPKNNLPVVGYLPRRSLKKFTESDALSIGFSRPDATFSEESLTALKQAGKNKISVRLKDGVITHIGLVENSTLLRNHVEFYTASGIANKFHFSLINGNSATEAKDFNGLKKLVLTEQTVRLSANGMTVATGNSSAAKTVQQAFLEGIDEAMSRARGTNKVILTNAKTLARLNSTARECVQYTLDSFGRRIATYNEAPLVNLEENGADVIPFSETVSTSNGCASLYVASFGEQENLSFFTTKEGFMVYPVKRVDNFYEQMIELICDSALVYDKAVSRLTGIKV